MKRADRAKRRVRRTKMLWLRHLAVQADPPFAAVVGLRGGEEIVALCEGLRVNCAERRVYGGNRVWAFHNGVGIVGTREHLERLDGHRPHVRQGTRGRPTRSLGYVRFDGMVLYSDSTDGDGWSGDIEGLVAQNAQPFGVVCHIGVGESGAIARDLEMLEPLMTDTTAVVLCQMDQVSTYEQFDRMCRDGWSGIQIAGLGLLQRRRHPAKE